MDNKFIEKFFCLDVFYCSLSLYLILLIIAQRNVLDIFYFGVLTFYYIKIKLCRKKEKSITNK